MHILRKFRLCDSIPRKACLRRLHFSYQAFHCSVKSRQSDINKLTFQLLQSDMFLFLIRDRSLSCRGFFAQKILKNPAAAKNTFQRFAKIIINPNV